MTFKNDAFCRIISTNWEEALLAYDLSGVGFVRVELTDSNGNVLVWKSEEGSGCGRLKLDKLNPDTLYHGVFSSGQIELPLNFKTLEAPQGKMSGSFALIADPHLSLKMENRKGRLLIESKIILQDVVNQCNQLSLDCVLLPGDITNSADEAEFTTAVNIIDQLSVPYFAAPGNHDVFCSADSGGYKLWQKFFGTVEGIFETSCGTLIALDTACGNLTDASAALLAEVLKKKRTSPLLVMTHFQLFDNEKVYRGKAQKVIDNATEYSDLLKQLTEQPAIIYVGHQNIPAVKTFGKAIQVNLPQPTQYPCGFIYVRCYKNIFYHSFKPISSEIMRQWSRCIGDLSTCQYNEIEWESDYREGKSIAEANFIVNFNY